MKNISDLMKQAGEMQSKMSEIHIVFVHPVEFLVTAPDGGYLDKRIFADPELRSAAMLVTGDSVDTDADFKRVCYFDLPLGK